MSDPISLPSDPPGSFEYLCISSLEELLALEAEWNALHESQAQPLLPMTHFWHRYWWQNFAEGLELATGCVRRSGELVAIAPLYSSSMRQYGLPLTTTELSGNGYSPFNDLLLARNLSERELDLVLLLLLRHNQGDVLRLAKLPAAGPTANRLLGQPQPPAKVGVTPNLRTPMITLESDWDSYLMTMSKSSRKSVRRKLSRLRNDPALEIREVVLQDSSEPILDEVLDISAQSWKADAGSDLRTDTHGRQFVWQLIDHLAATGGATAWVLYNNNQPIAYELHLSYAGVVYPIRADYSKDYASYSPGSILMAHALKQLMQRGEHRTYDCCGNDYDYLRSWSSEISTYIDIEMFSENFRGRLAYGLKYQLAPAVRKLTGRPDATLDATAAQRVAPS